MTCPSVSVLMAVFNGIPHVREAVESVLSQSFDDLELIVVDDGSDDGSREYLESVADTRLKVTLGAHEGLTEALINATTVATGRYVARQDADDLSSPNRFEAQVAYLESHPDSALVGSAYSVIDGVGRSLFDRAMPSGTGITDALGSGKSPFAHGAVMMRRDVLDEVGGYRSQFHFAQDFDLWLRIAERHQTENLSESLYRWRLPAGGDSSRKRYQQKAYVRLALECARARQVGEPEPLERVALIRNTNPGWIWRAGFAGNAALRRVFRRVGVDY